MFANREKRVCILIPLVQMSEGINFKQGFQGVPDEMFSPVFTAGVKTVCSLRFVITTS